MHCIRLQFTIQWSTKYKEFWSLAKLEKKQNNGLVQIGAIDSSF